MKQHLGMDMKFSTFENVEKSLAEVQISVMQYMPHAIHMFLTLIKDGLFLATSLTHDGNGRLVGGSPACGHRKQVQSQLSPSKMKGCKDIEPRTMTEPCKQGLDVRPKVLDHQTWGKMQRFGSL
jgi:hypothetical protein